MVFGRTHRMALLLLLRGRQFGLDAQVTVEDAMHVYLFLWG